MPYEFCEEGKDDFTKFDVSQLKKINTNEFAITDLYNWKFQYFSINFDDYNFCQWEGYITCNLINYKFDNAEQIRPNRHSPILKRETDLDFANYITKNKNWMYEKQRLLKPLITPSDIGDLKAHNLTEFLFGAKLKAKMQNNNEIIK